MNKIYDTPKTPYDRLIEGTGLSEKAKSNLKALHEAINPITLSQALDQAMKHFKQVVRRHQTGGRDAAA